MYTISLRKGIQTYQKVVVWVDLTYLPYDLESLIRQDWSELLFHCQFNTWVREPAASNLLLFSKILSVQGSCCLHRNFPQLYV